jgi:hypothetical protein
MDFGLYHKHGFRRARHFRYASRTAMESALLPAANKKRTAFIELEAAIHACGELV